MSDDPQMRDILADHLEAQDSEWHEQKPGVYHISSVGYCKRKNWYRIRGLPEDLPLGLFAMGHAVEAEVFDALKARYGEKFVKNDYPVKHDAGEFSVVGATDPVIIGYNAEILRLYEVKSSRAKHENRLKDTHRLQAGFYAHLLDVPEVRIVHPNRDDVLDIPDDYEMEADEREVLFDESVEYFADLHRYVDAGELPPAEPRGSWECRWSSGQCPFLDRCRADGGWTRVKNKTNDNERWMLKVEAEEKGYEIVGEEEE